MSRQFVKLEPESELKFTGPFTNVIATHLKLTCLADKPVLFKIKTTAPRRYCVRPNCGLIKPHETADIAVILQPFTYDPQDKNKHKFMVQSMLAPDDFDLKNLDNVFKSAQPQSIADSKLKCVFEMPEEQEIQPARSNFVSSSPSNTPVTPTAATNVIEGLPDRGTLLKQLNRMKEENEALENRLRIAKANEAVHSAHAQLIPPPTGKSSGAVNSFPPILHILLALVLGLIIGKYVL